MYVYTCIFSILGNIHCLQSDYYFYILLFILFFFYVRGLDLVRRRLDARCVRAVALPLTGTAAATPAIPATTGTTSLFAAAVIILLTTSAIITKPIPTTNASRSKIANAFPQNVVCKVVNRRE